MAKVSFCSTASSLSTEHELMKKIEFAQTRKRIQNFATFLPDRVLEMRIDDLHKQHDCVGIVLCTEIYGLTDLAMKYSVIGQGGMYKLTATLNAYIGSVMEVLATYGGDVLKFTGDSILTQWVVLPHNSLVDILHEVVNCALFMKAHLGRYLTETSVVITMKNAISCGNMCFFFMGDDKKKDYALAGESINDMATVLEHAFMGDVIMSTGTWAHMLQERYEVLKDGSYIKVLNIAYQDDETISRIHVDQEQMALLQVLEYHKEHRDKVYGLKELKTYKTSTDFKNELVKKLPPRKFVRMAPRNWSIEELMYFVVKPVFEQLIESQPVEYLTQLHELTIQFISIKPRSYYDIFFIDLLRKMFDLIYHYCGDTGTILHISNLSQSVTAVIVFGLKGDKTAGTQFHDSLISGYKLRNDIRKLANVVEISVAIKNGLFYCGVIGHPLRRDFIVIGATTSKLKEMVRLNPNKVTCDFKTLRNSKLASFNFKATNTTAKNKQIDQDAIFEYEEHMDDRGPKLPQNLPILGRNLEVNAIQSIVCTPTVTGYYGICFCGREKIGKSAILNNSRETFRIKASECVVIFVPLDGSSKIPYYCVSKIYRKLFDMNAKEYVEGTGTLLCLPRDLYYYIDSLDKSEHVAVHKYRVLNIFRDMINFSRKLYTIIYIDNAHELDLQSWEILEIVLSTKKIRLVLAGCFDEKKYWNLRFKMSINHLIKVIELKKLGDEYTPAISCQFLKVGGVPKRLIKLLVESCDGRPGYIQNCLLSLVNRDEIELKSIFERDKNYERFFYPAQKYTGYDFSFKIPVAVFKQGKCTSSRLNRLLTMDTISLDLFESFTPYEQLVIKTGSVLGTMFTRMLLIIALRIPPEKTLADVILSLFDADVFECGGNYMYANDNMENESLCCACYFEDGYFAPIFHRCLPRYAYCKILRFRNKTLRNAAYRSIPQNQKDELHSMCTDILENMNHRCPTCLVNPVNDIFRLGKFKDMMTYCNNLEMAPTVITEERSIVQEIKEDIRAIFKSYADGRSTQKQRRSTSRPFFTPANCNCLEILLRVYNDLMYHSKASGHLAKRIHFTLHYGLLLLNIRDFTTSIGFLTIARELCLNNCNDTDVELISDTFRKLNIGKIEIALATASMELGQLKAAKNHLAIALRQYNIPTLALSYKLCKPCLTRRILLCNMQNNTKIPYKNVIARCDMAQCMALCSSIFYQEGKYKMAKFTANYSIFLIKSVNPNVQVLLEIYCTAIDTHRYLSDPHVSEKLVRSLAIEVMENYCLNSLYNGYYISTLLGEVFKAEVAGGDIVKAIRIGYRVVDLNRILLNTNNYIEVLMTLSTLLTNNYRIREAAAICGLVPVTAKNYLLVYYTLVMNVYLKSTFEVEDMENIIEFGEDFIKKRSNRGWDDYRFIILMRAYYIRNGFTEEAEKWKSFATFDENNIRKLSVLSSLSWDIECQIFLYLRATKMNSPELPNETKIIKDSLILFQKGVRAFKTFQPRYFYLTAWFTMIRQKKRLAFRLLEKSRIIAERQNNLNAVCFAMQLKNAWTGGYTHRFSAMPYNSYLAADDKTLTEWAQLMPAYPLE